MQGLCQGRNVTQSPGLTSTIKDHPSSLPVLQIFPEIRVQDRQLRGRIDNLEKPPWRNAAIGNS